MATRRVAASVDCTRRLMLAHNASRHANGHMLLAVVALVATWALVHGSLVIFRGLPLFETGLLGPDSYMRMGRVTALAHGGGWYADTLHRVHHPDLAPFHCARPHLVPVSDLDNG